ncbi:hypothetical protein KTS45_09615 [Halomicroarcula limicola]|uniref:Uncharacterized protein n=1 Tax=Haloarcula limicola TaxID=1429915 RepID=A0A8J7Y4R4_9EURY|nr:hypothetical protein [Halomicroarcula limicola]MBV0924455.1 hypothetical protein [Halomicroarcula limicola]
MPCPYLEYRERDGEQSFDTARAFCAVAGEFVQPMRADVCNDRYALDHEHHCEIYRAHAESGGEGE